MIIATCGHDIDNTMGYLVKQYDMDREGNHCFSYPVLCKKCYKWYRRHSLINKVISIEDWKQ